MSTNLEQRTLPEMPVVYLRHTGPYMEAGPVWEQLVAWANRQGIIGPETCFVGACYDDPQVTPPEKIRYDACLSLTPGQAVRTEGAIATQTIGGGQYAVARHHGPCENLMETYQKLYYQWLPDSGWSYQESAPALEFYLNDPRTTLPSELVTEIYVALK